MKLSYYPMDIFEKVQGTLPRVEHYNCHNLPMSVTQVNRNENQTELFKANIYCKQAN